jgi:hypothetical protein
MIKLTKGTIIQVKLGATAVTFVTRLSEAAAKAMVLGLLKNPVVTTSTVMSRFLSAAPTTPAKPADMYGGFPMMVIDVCEREFRVSRDCWASSTHWRLESTMVGNSGSAWVQRFEKVSENNLTTA